MRLFGHTVARMYVTAIVLLVFLAGVSSYMLHELPYALVVATLACAAIEIIEGGTIKSRNSGSLSPAS